MAHTSDHFQCLPDAQPQALSVRELDEYVGTPALVVGGPVSLRDALPSPSTSNQLHYKIMQESTKCELPASISDTIEVTIISPSTCRATAFRIQL